MDSASTTNVKALWQEEGDIRLATNPRDGSPRGIISSTNDHDVTANQDIHHADGHDVDDNEEKEAQTPVSKLLPAGSCRVSHEKPLFPSLTPSGAAVPLVLTPGDVAGNNVPYTVNRYLRDYQREGIRFIHDNYSRSRGCILGDDMGLGKTVQIIGFLSAVLQKTGTWEDLENNKPRFLRTQSFSEQRGPYKVFLVVAPLSVLYNWKEELDSWGHFRVVVIHGLRKDEDLCRISDGRFEVALTTYESLRLCLDQFNSINWTAVIVDEAHKLKNPKSKITLAMKTLNCKVRIGLTGTILQNNLEEFWTVMDWAVPSCLGSLGHFKNRYCDPVEQGQKHSATKRALATARRAVRTLATKISPWFLRRTKALIQEQLPRKDDRVVYCALTDFQRSVYQAVLDTEDVALILRSADKCDCQSGRARRRCCYRRNSDGVEVKDLYFSYLAVLRKVANHVALLQSADGTSKRQKELVATVCEKVFQRFPDFVQRCKEEAFAAMSDPMYSGKMKVLQKLLRHYLERRDKVLLFSLSTKLLDVLGSYCMAEGLDYSRLDGNTKARERVNIVKEFNTSPHTNLCLVSTMAGGLGLNFVGANVVVLFDPTWNPANDLQAIDRAYRIGQCRDLTVLRLISLGTVEEIIYLRQIYKQQLQSTVVERQSARRYFEAVQGPDGTQGELFGIGNLFRLQTQGTCLTRQLLEREGLVEAGVITASTHVGVAAAAQKEREREEEAEPETSVEPGKYPPSSASGAARPQGQGVPNRTSRGVLDFSSGSEEGEAGEEVGGSNVKTERTADPRGDEGATGGTATTISSTATAPTTSSSSSRPSLLQCGLSRLLQGGAASPVVSGVEESSLSEGGSERGGGTGPEERPPGRAGGCSSHKKNRKRTMEEEEEGDTSQGSSSGSRGNRRPIGCGITAGGGGGRVGGPGRRSDPDGGWASAGRAEGARGNARSSEVRAAVPRWGPTRGSDSEESDDLGVASKGRVGGRVRGQWGGGGAKGTGRKRRSAKIRGAARSERSERIEAFTSSEEERSPAKRGRSARVGGSKMADHAAAAVSRGTERGPFTPLTPTQTQGCGNIDAILGGVSQVLYTHSNQRVVGGSKAEERISRAAMRDVFENKMFSQFPANHLVGTQESEEEDVPETSGPPALPPATGEEVRAGAGGERPLHPVTFDLQAVHRGREETFILGQTPQAIRRQQLEQMASGLGFSSPRVFAEEVLRCASAQRLTWLRRYYSSLDRPDLDDLVSKNFPDPAAPTALPCPPAPETPRRRRGRTKGSQKDRGGGAPPSKPQSPRIPRGAVRRGRQNVGKSGRTRRASASAARAAGGPGSDQEVGSGLEFSGEDPPAAPPHPAGRDRPSPPASPAARLQGVCLEPSAGAADRTAPPRPGPPPRCEPPSPSPASLLNDLLGDTSILDDLLRPPASARQRLLPTATPSPTLRLHGDSSRDAAAHSASPPPPPPRRKAATGCKDFWDILNEGSEESLERLADLSVLERVRLKTDPAAPTSSGGGEASALWKTNRKFLWRK